MPLATKKTTEDFYKLIKTSLKGVLLLAGNILHCTFNPYKGYLLVDKCDLKSGQVDM